MGYYFLLFLIPLFVWLGIAKLIFRHEFCWKEMGIQFSITSVVILLVVLISGNLQTRDYKFVNGNVIEIDYRREYCPVGWVTTTDNFCTKYWSRQVKVGETCRTSSDGRKSCTPNYRTEYQYIYPWEQRYFVYTDIENYEIDRIDGQGANIPPRWAEIKVGDPVSKLEYYVNYIKGASDTLFNQKYEDVPPISYPGIRDYYKANRVIYFGGESDASYMSQWEEWNSELSVVNSNLKETGANVIINVVGETQDWAERLAQAWDAHNINDIVISIGTSGDNISWVDVRSWSSNNLVNISIRDEILNIKVVDKTKINDIIEKYVKEYYVEQPMENFEYLADDIPPPAWMFVLIGIILLIITPFVSYTFSKPENRF